MGASIHTTQANNTNFGFELIKYIEEFTEDSILIVDRNFNLKYANSCAAKLFGHAETSLVGKNLEEICRDTFFQTSQEKLRQTLDQGVPVGFDTNIEAFGGTVWLDTQMTPIQDDSNKTVAALMVSRNITERKNRETHISQAQNQWLKVIDSIPHLFALIDHQFRILHVNAAMAERLGIDVHKARGLVCYEYLNVAMRPPRFCPLLKSMVDDHRCQSEWHKMHEDGPFLVSVSPFVGAGGRITGCIYMACGVAKTADKNPATEHCMKMLMKEADEIIFVQDRSGRYVFISASPMHGFQFKEIIGTSPRDCFDEENASRIVDRVKCVAASGIELAELMEYKRDGETIRFLDHISPIRGSGGYVTSVVTISQKLPQGRQTERRGRPPDKKLALTKREIEVLKLIAAGLTNQQIAEQLHISRKTVETHRSRIMQKLDIHKMSGLVKHAVQSGLVQ